MPLKFLIIWNPLPSNFSEVLKISFFMDLMIGSLLREKFPYFEEPEITLLENEKDLFDEKMNLKDPRKCKEYDAVFILAELTWWDYPYTAFAGFSITMKLRKSDISSPVFLISNMDRNELLMQKNPAFKILNIPGHYFIQIKNDGIKVDKNWKFKRLSGHLLEDLNFYFNSSTGLVTESIHHIKNKILKLYGQREALIDEKHINREIKYEIHDILKLIPQKAQREFEAHVNEMVSRLIQHENKLVAVEIFKNSVLQSLNKAYSDSLPSLDRVMEWQVLFVEDDEHVRALVKEMFKEHGIRCITAAGSGEAMEILHADQLGELKNKQGYFHPQNSITVLISDVRLIQSSGQWDEFQGYDLVEEIYLNFSNMLSFFLLTNKTSSMKLGFNRPRVHQEYWYSKEVLFNPGSFNLFVQRIIEEGNRIYQSLLSSPKGTYWHKAYITSKDVKIAFPLKEYYRRYRLSALYRETELRICQTAVEFVEKVHAEKMEHGNIDRIDKFELRSSLPNLPHEFDETMNKFVEKLIGRRIVIGLWLCNLRNEDYDKDTDYLDSDSLLIQPEHWSIEEIAFLLGKGYLPSSLGEDIGENAGKVVESVIKSVINTHLAFSKHLNKDIPENLLVEEKQWIENNLGVHIFLYRQHKLRAKLKDTGRILGELADEINKETIRLKKDNPGLFEKILEQYGEFLSMEIYRVDDMDTFNHYIELFRNLLDREQFKISENMRQKINELAFNAESMSSPNVYKNY